MYKDILYEVDSPAAVLTLNRPGSLNAFTQLMLAEVRHALMMMKRQVYKHMNAELGAAMAQTNQWMDESLERSDFAEGVKSFMEKRAPNFAPLQAD